MTGLEIPADVLKWAGASLAVGGSGAAIWAALADPQGWVNRQWVRYTGYLERKLHMMFIWVQGSAIAIGQLVAIVGVIATHIMVDLPLWYLLCGAIAVGPSMYVERMRRKRVEAIENQLDGFLTALANGLKSTPSIGDAINSVQTLLHPPLSQEVELAVKEMRVGTTLDQALLRMAGRVGSRQLDSALSSIIIGRQIGGNLPKILATTAETLREMARLEGVVRSKTAEGKAQMWVLALFPFLLVLALNSMKEGYFDPLTQSVTGYIVATVAAVFWIASLVVARKVLAVDV
ncbi:MAG: type II secretion system F family protein [Deltaproteobacteria bacterium]|nr:type II secretion system F family protein [Deltaproteobacteria bacterium]